MKWKIKETAHFLNAVSKLHTYNNVLSKHDSDGNWTFAVKRQSWSPIMCPRDSWENQKSDTRFICASLTPYIGLCNNHFLLPALFLLGNPSRMKSNHKSDGTKQQRADIILAGCKMKKKILQLALHKRISLDFFSGLKPQCAEIKHTAQ